MRLTFVLAAALAAAALTSTAQAEAYSDPDANFKVNVPEGWKAGKVTNEFVKLMLVTANDKDHVGICVVVTQKHPETVQQSQAEIDAQMAPLVDEKFWEFALTMSPGIDEPKVVSTTTNVRGGRNVYSAVLSFKVADKASGTSGDAMGREIMLVIPGQFYFVTCMTSAANYATMEGQFDTVLDSFEPLGAATVARNETPGVAALTLYSDAKFGGVSRVVTKDTPDLSIYGAGKIAGSASVSGPASWELCSGANYSGQCRVVSGALASDLGMRDGVLSARQLRGSTALKHSLAGDAARALGETIQRTHGQ